MTEQKKDEISKGMEEDLQYLMKEELKGCAVRDAYFYIAGYAVGVSKDSKDLNAAEAMIDIAKQTK